MAFISKKRKVADTKVDANKAYSLKEASTLVKTISTCKFDASVDLHIRLGVDPKKADQAIRGTVSLPHGTGKTKKVLVPVSYTHLDVYKRQVWKCSANCWMKVRLVTTQVCCSVVLRKPRSVVVW